MPPWFVDQKYRICTICNKKCLSGAAHIERGAIAAFLCYKCGDEDVSIDRLKRLTKHNKGKIRKRNE